MSVRGTKKKRIKNEYFYYKQSGVWQTTLIQYFLNEIFDKKVSGSITPEIKANGPRLGFKIIDLASRKEEILASVDTKRGPGVLRCKINVEGIDLIMDEFLENYESAEYFVIDGIEMM